MVEKKYSETDLFEKDHFQFHSLLHYLQVHLVKQMVQEQDGQLGLVFFSDQDYQVF